MTEPGTVPGAPRVVAVVVSYNRRELLARSLAALTEGLRLPDALVVVDNASTDGSADFLAGLDVPFEYELVRLEQNTGGAGGFAVGMAAALARHSPDLIWVMDDDTVPLRGTLDEAVRLWESCSAIDRPAFIASRVVWTDGRDHPMNTMRDRWGASSEDVAFAHARRARVVRSASFVSLFVDADTVRALGLPVADFFLWNDDFEFTARLARRRLGLASLDSVVEHHTRLYDSNTADVGDRFRFEVRNKMWTFFRSPALAPVEKALYGASTLRRWGVMVRSSPRPRVVLRAGFEGLLEGLSRGPRPNEEVLAPVGGVPDAAPSRPQDAPLANVTAHGEDGGFPEFSVLLPVYAGDSAARVRRAIASVTTDQTVAPSQLVIVRDGPVGEDIERLLVEAERDGSVPADVVRLPAGVGLAEALDAGLERCRHDVVARMDADDVALPARFERQLALLGQGYDIVGSAIAEIGDDEARPFASRPVPASHREIMAQLDFRTPFNHPSVMYRASAVRAAGGYRGVPDMEDYWLWARMLHGGSLGANVPDVLVLYRVNDGAYVRRGGKRMLVAELRLQRRMLGERYIGPLGFARNVLVRGLYRLVPTGVRRRGYRTAFTERPAPAEQSGTAAPGEAAG
ncbi:glycosyltransferase [Sinomonas sp. ASV322]|uniref:glycosyltransferase n=1 Tax=Sinomonas sp. ASV322 TaxID=3041920 RepID=UPI0027DDB64F|nr:glycosyltransferase [Sinomonas sp. ASV322]MDQ4502050.1 glycosyltransferase [Sinomonas sp. ASV322]